MTIDSADVVQCSVSARISRIAFNRPARKNAIDSAVPAALRAALDRIENDPDIRVVVLIGRARATGMAWSADTLDTALEAERNAQGLLGAHPDYREAVAAFMSKRTPRFQ